MYFELQGWLFRDIDLLKILVKISIFVVNYYI